MKVHHIQHFHGRLLASIRTGAWAALHKHCQSMLSAHQGAADYKTLESTCRHTAFVRAYMEAYLRKGEFFEPTNEVVADIADYVAQHRTTDQPFDYAFAGIHRPGEDLRQRHADLADLGVTWWRDTWDPEFGVEHEAWLADVLEGPPVR